MIKKDSNDWWLVAKNPVMKTGILEYLGSEISADLEPNKIYKVYVPEESLNQTSVIESLNGLPLLLEHEMLGKEFSNYDSNPAHGAVFNGVYEDGFLKADIKIFSDAAKEKLESGERELSLGYRCTYEKANSHDYDYVQKDIQANHLIICPEGRAGREVSVSYNARFALNTQTIFKNECKNEETKTMNPELVAKLLELLKSAGVGEAIVTGVSNLLAEGGSPDAGVATDEAPANIPEAPASENAELEEDKALNEELEEDKALNEDEEKKEEEAENEDAPFEKKEEETATAENSKRALLRELDARNYLADKLKKHIGEFSFNSMTLRDVAKYGCKKLELKANKGEELPMIRGYLAAMRKEDAKYTVAMNNHAAKAKESSFINKLFN